MKNYNAVKRYLKEIEMSEKKKSLWEQMGRKTGSSSSSETKEKMDKEKEKKKVVANIRGTKIYGK